MLLKRFSTGAGVLAAAVAFMLATQSSAIAQTSTGDLENWVGNCDAVVAISDDLIGSPGRIEAWGGYSCSNPQKWGGVLRIQIFKGSQKVADKVANWPLGTTGHVETSVANTSGTQAWYAKMIISSTMSQGGTVRTGTIYS
ncbi:hypothetical protein SMD20_47550 [Nonomuraea sp. LP-02]|uniref:hypothetical protein n=1 Tax=Nonomuraea sp. LP-02 TaxID=3097960 RepID=UPI002E371D16|nr:hypothetical protein [Nonomuraea sp. LP-02]MED7931950.1 hypothetical protein [Nonomuraea sp. LP-02]